MNWFKKISEKALSAMTSPLNSKKAPYFYPSIQQMASFSGVNRRKNIRVIYPRQEMAEKLPRIRYKGQEFPVQDISIGGACLIHRRTESEYIAGSDVILTLSWTDAEFLVPSQIVGLSFERIHIHFASLPPDVESRLNLSVKPGIIGNTFKKASVESNERITVSAKEIWIGNCGESLVFHKGVDDFTELFIFDLQFRFRNGRPEGSSIIDPAICSDILICLANINSPSERIQNFINEFETYLCSKVA